MTHAEVLRQCRGARLVALAGGSRAPKLAERYGVECLDSVDELLQREDLDAIIITTPHFCHFGEALLALESGKHILVEKPMATSVEDCEEMIRAAQLAGLKVQVAYHQRFRQVSIAAKNLLAEGTIGKVLAIRSTMISPGGTPEGWHRDPRSLGWLIGYGCHALDLFRWLLECEAESVFASGGTVREEVPVENQVMMQIRFTDGTPVSFWCSNAIPKPGLPDSMFRFEIMGEEGWLDLKPFSELRLARDVDGRWETVATQPPIDFGSEEGRLAPARLGAYVAEVQAFVDCIREGKEPPVTGEDGRASVELALAAYKSLQEGSLVTLPLT